MDDVVCVRRASTPPNGFIISPPLVISREECDLLVERTAAALDDLADALTRDGAFA